MAETAAPVEAAVEAAADLAETAAPATVAAVAAVDTFLPAATAAILPEASILPRQRAALEPAAVAATMVMAEPAAPASLYLFTLRRPMMTFYLYKDNVLVNSIEASESFCAKYCKENGYTYAAAPVSATAPPPSDTDPVTWAAMAAAIREGVNEV